MADAQAASDEAGGPVARSLAQQEEYRVRDTDGDREPVTERGRYLLRRTYGGRSRPRADFERLRDDIRVIEAEAALLARRAPGDRDTVREALADALAAPHPGVARTYDGRSLTHCDCDEHRHLYAVLSSADSRPEQPAPLDVERLARAIFEVERPDESWPTWEEYRAAYAYPPAQDDVRRRSAARVAAEYERLSRDARPEEPPAPQIDVERLARVLGPAAFEVADLVEHGGWCGDDPTPECLAQLNAEAIVRHYHALAPVRPEEPPE